MQIWERNKFALEWNSISLPFFCPGGGILPEKLGGGVRPTSQNPYPNYEGLPGVLGNKGTLAKYRREQGNISHFLGTGEQNSKNYEGEQITKMCGNMGI